MSSESDHSWRFENSFCMTYLQHLLATCRHESEYCLSWTQLFWMTGTLLLILSHNKARFIGWEDGFCTFPFPTHVFKFSKGQFSLTNALVSRLPVIFVYHVSHPPARNFEPCKVKGFLQFSQGNESEKWFVITKNVAIPPNSLTLIQLYPEL